MTTPTIDQNVENHNYFDAIKSYVTSRVLI